jgi:hypothetical protein
MNEVIDHTRPWKQRASPSSAEKQILVRTKPGIPVPWPLVAEFVGLCWNIPGLHSRKPILGNFVGIWPCPALPYHALPYHALPCPALERLLLSVKDEVFHFNNFVMLLKGMIDHP